MTDTAPTARARAREAVHASILAAARVRLTDEGPSQLSLRAVARDVGMVSSAVYRYFPSRDDLLTALLIADYDELGAAVEAADAAAGPAPGARWVAVCRAIRTWSIAHPGDFALLFGSPVPGYAAPRSTVEPASRTTLTIVRVVADAVADPGYRAPDAPRSGPGRLTPAVADGVESLRAFGTGLPEEVLARTLMAWTTVFGTVSFELFGHYVGSVSDGAAFFDEVVARLAEGLGIVAAFD
ncbi:TetR/AcrR family transcriptional regulator [Curtobacterium sp. AB451]|uniref:TetR/AcrR family transcriptional regulator n=1 Tax=unclassified Curtobacterium TaxID=257496 RepID=UPI0003483D79|nr:TetR/AcrR family transcriptional regulator [Curtobacterium sp. B18]